MPKKEAKPTGKTASSSLRIGAKYLIRGVTHYWTGRLAAITETDLVLEDAAWIADTGRFHDALKTGSFSEVEPFLGPAIVFRGGLIDATELTGDLPKDQR
jgi:hypothetical protein